MALSMRDIRRRIKSMKNTQQITKAMEMVAAAKLRRAQEAVRNTRPYSEKIRDVVTTIAQKSGYRHPMLRTRPVRTTGYLIITSDRGSAGPYNTQVLRHAQGLMDERPDSEALLFVVGRKGRDYYRRRRRRVAEEVVGIPDIPGYGDVRRIAETIVKMYGAEVYDELYVIYQEFRTALTQVPVAKRILPLDPSEFEAGKGPLATYEYEPSPEKVLDALLPKYAETLIYHGLLEAKASEHSARMRAMGQAKDNAGKMVDRLTLSLNRARQAAITTQIAEIVGGAEALK